MRKAFFTLTVLFAMMVAGLSAKAQEITITLLPGCTWISYTGEEAMSIATALGDFVPMEGDVIKSQYASTTYNHGRWMGRLQQFTPGLGYMYISRRGEPVSLVFATPSAPEGALTVTTSEPTDITETTVTCGGSAVSNDGTFILMKGVCWATHPQPTTNDTYSENGSGPGAFSTEITGLVPNTVYYVRTYAASVKGTVYGEEKTFTTMSGIPVVSTAEVTNVTATTATCGGTITTDGGLPITARGVCWSTSPNPILSNSHTTDGTGTGSFTSSLTGLSASTTYYVRAYASNSNGTIYGNEVSFTTEAGGSGDHEYVDLGLPSGTLWATCNVGANSPEDYGDYFAWGETTPKDNYNWSNYQYCMGSSSTLTKYCNNSSYGYEGFTDDLTTLLPEDDAATANWGSGWRMPTKEEWQELYNNTTVTWTTQNGVNGRLFTATNGNSLFLPAAGCCYSNSLNYAGSNGHYWSGSLYSDYPDGAWDFAFSSGNYRMYYYTRHYGRSVRGVRSSRQN